MDVCISSAQLEAISSARGFCWSWCHLEAEQAVILTGTKHWHQHTKTGHRNKLTDVVTHTHKEESRPVFVVCCLQARKGRNRFSSLRSLQMKLLSVTTVRPVSEWRRLLLPQITGTAKKWAKKNPVSSSMILLELVFLRSGARKACRSEGFSPSRSQNEFAFTSYPHYLCRGGVI